MARNKPTVDRAEQAHTTEPTETTEQAGTTAAPSEDAAAAADDAVDEVPAEKYAFPIPDEFKPKKGVELLMQACTLYNIDPSDQADPVQLRDWKFYAGDRRSGRPDRIVLVTAGGLKVAHPADDDTYERLTHVFRLRREKKQKDGSVEIEILPLPDDLSLPSGHLHGYPEGDSDRRYGRGYLKEGGAAEFARREARRNAQLPK